VTREVAGFAPSAAAAIDAARRLAEAEQHLELHPEHLALAVLAEAPAAVAELLGPAVVAPADPREVAGVLPLARLPEQIDPPPLSALSVSVLESALAEAVSAGAREIDARHLLVALLAVAPARVAPVLFNAESLERLRRLAG
jgi:ATP-dependent Clp protease ATP-binding subunit ClpA